MKKVLIIDHYDSFSFNLQEYCKNLGAEVLVVKCDIIELSIVENFSPTHIVFSPGPGSVYNPQDIGNSSEILKSLMGNLPMLGVCLGHQLMAQFFGAEIIYTEPKHGKRESISVKGHKTLFRGFSDDLEGMRYHSMVISPKDASQLIQQGWGITAYATSDDHIMAIEHELLQLYGIQFHPESIGTQKGLEILRNFLDR